MKNSTFTLWLSVIFYFLVYNNSANLQENETCSRLGCHRFHGLLVRGLDRAHGRNTKRYMQASSSQKIKHAKRTHTATKSKEEKYALVDQPLTSAD
jgi:hypothetical protein